MFNNRFQKYFQYAQMTSFIFETIIEFSDAIRNVNAQLVLMNRGLTYTYEMLIWMLLWDPLTYLFHWGTRVLVKGLPTKSEDLSVFVLFFLLSYFSLPPSASLDFSLISQPISMKFGMLIVLDETKRCLKFQVNRTRGRDRAWSQSFTMLYNRKNSIYCA